VVGSSRRWLAAHPRLAFEGDSGAAPRRDEYRLSLRRRGRRTGTKTATVTVTVTAIVTATATVTVRARVAAVAAAATARAAAVVPGRASTSQRPSAHNPRCASPRSLWKHPDRTAACRGKAGAERVGYMRAQ